jgi:hypothetical protein
MTFNKNTMKTIQKIAADKQWHYFFQNIENKADQVPEDLIGLLVDMLSSEIGAKPEDIEKIRYFIKLGFFAHE